MGFFEAAHGWLGANRQGLLPKFVTQILQWWKLNCYTLPKKDPKNIWIIWRIPWVLLSSAIFQRKSANFAISRNTCIDCTWYKIMNSFKFSWFFKDFLIKKVTILMMSAKIATPDLLKITIFWNKGYDVIIYVHDVTIKISSCDSNYIMDVVMWPKLGKSNISIREVMIIY